MRRALFFVTLILVVNPATALGQGARIEAIGAIADPGASEALKKVLEQKGSRLTIGDGPYCDIWLRSGLPAGKSDAAQGAVYNLGESVLVGVITFARATTDFRGQAVKQGTYTLRYAIHPADGNHLGISPIRDFLVLVPVAMDQNPEAQPKFEELMKMSPKSTGTNHPGVISLVQTEGASPPKLEQDGSHFVFTAKVKSQSGAEVPIAFIVKGHAEQ
ncbi:MAG TPA: hypothetical protein VLM38_01210 [Blastocatellia bacterium]|nr:hypothetical protein [Blastocatellia bacterium]